MLSPWRTRRQGGAAVCAGHLYAMGHANATSTVIEGLGRVPGTFDDPVYFRRGVTPVLDPIFGE